MEGSPTVIGAMPPPPGVMPNFVNPESRAGTNIALHTTCLILVTFFLVMRIYTRKFISRWIGWDDYACLIAYAMTIVFSGLQLFGHRYGFGRHLWDVPATSVPKMLRILFASQLFYNPLVTVVKITFLFFFERLFFPSPKAKIFMRVGSFICIIFYTTIFFRALFVCSPMQKIWNPLLPGHCLNVVVLPYTSAIFNVLSDVYILLIPLPFLWGLKIRMDRKLRLMAIFSVGLFACAASITRLIVTVQTIRNPDFTWNLFTLGFWSLIEIDVAIICACSLALPAFIDRHLSHGLDKYVSKLSSYFRSSHNQENSTERAKSASISNGNLVSDSSFDRRGVQDHESRAGKYLNIDDQIELESIERGMEY